jgi:hypothetical protein
LRNIVNIGWAGKSFPSQFLTDWCDANVKHYEVKRYMIYYAHGWPADARRNSVRYDEDDLLMFIVRWAGEFHALDGSRGKFPLGPYSEDEMKKAGPLPELM